MTRATISQYHLTPLIYEPVRINPLNYRKSTNGPSIKGGLEGVKVIHFYS